MIAVIAGFIVVVVGLLVTGGLSLSFGRSYPQPNIPRPALVAPRKRAGISPPSTKFQSLRSYDA